VYPTILTIPVVAAPCSIFQYDPTCPDVNKLALAVNVIPAPVVADGVIVVEPILESLYGVANPSTLLLASIPPAAKPKA